MGNETSAIRMLRQNAPKDPLSNTSGDICPIPMDLPAIVSFCNIRQILEITQQLGIAQRGTMAI